MTAAAKPSLAEALVAALSEMPAVKDDAKATVPMKSGGQFSYGYVTLDHLVAQTRPVLKKHGLAILQHVAVLDTGQPVLRTTILHTSGESFNAGELPLFAEKAMQPFGGAVTYARRYAWAAALGICAEADDDAAQASAPAAAETKKTGPPEPTADQLTALYALVEERGGDTATTMNAAETAGERGKLANWYVQALKHWQSQPVATEFQKKAADAIVAGGAAQDARAAQAQADRGEKAVA